MLVKNILRFLLIFLVSESISAQTLIINEVSQGPSGNKEYVELLVVPTSNQLCSNSCLDIRGWIIDDNNGFFSGGPITSTGIASGAVRFSSNSLWSCVPIGTLIVIYNSSDLNSAMPPNDFSLTDGNCKLILPVTSNLLESQTSSPTTTAPASSSYPSSGWVSPPTSWNPLGMSNSDDSFQIYNSNNTTFPIHGVSWGNNNSNNIIYFSGSAANRVFFFSNNIDNNFNNQNNWTSGTCSSPDLQTPGDPNNLANSAYINSISNNCQTITPLALSLSGTVSQSCTCDGSATISASGSIGPYSYTWYDQANLPIGQTTNTASNLCSGYYYCVGTSSIGCSDTIAVFVGSICSNYGTFASAAMIQNCLNNQFYNTTASTPPDSINPSAILLNQYDFGPFFQNSNTLILRGGEVKTFKNPGSNVCGAKLNYTIYTVGNQPTNPIFTILDLPFKESCAVGPNSFPTGGPCFNATDQKWAKENYNIDLTTLAPGDYVLEVYYSVPGSFTSTTACNDTIYVNNNENNYKAFFQIKPTPNITASSVNICPGNNATLTSNYSTGNSWTGGSTSQSITVNTSGTTTLTVNLNNNCPNQTDTETINVYAPPTVEAGANQSTCGTNAVTLSGVIGGSATGSQWVSPSGTFSNVNSLNSTFTPSITSGVATVILSATGPCPTVQDQLVILVNATPTVNAGLDQTICAGNSINISGTYGGSANASSWSAPSGTFGNSTNLSTTYTPTITSGTVTLTLSASGPCPTVNDQLILTVNPIATSDAGIDQSICAGASVNLSGTIAGGAFSGTWSGGTGTFIPNSNSLNATYTPSASEISAGTVSLTLTSDDPAGPCVAATDQLIVTIDPIATVNAGSDQTICANSIAPLSGIIGGSATSAIWTGGSGTFSPNASTLNASYTPSAAEISAGSVALTLTTNDPIGSCSAVSDNVNILINQVPTSNAGIDQSICAGASVNLSGTIAGGAFSGTWSGGTGTFIPNSNSLNATYTPSASEISSGTVSLTLTTDDPAGPCIATTDQTMVTIDPIATVNAGSDQTICANSIAPLSGIIGGSATSAIWTGGSGTFSPNASTLNASYTPSAAEISAGSVALTLTTNDPIGSCSAVSDNVMLTITAAPVVNAGNNTSICLGGTVTLNGSISGTITGGIWSASSGTFSDINSFSSTYSPSITSGNITLTLTSVGPCPAVSDAVSINIIQPTVPIFNQQGPYCVGTTFTLPTLSTNGIFGIWSPAINNLNTTNYTFTPNLGQCATSASMNVTIIPDQTNSITLTVCPSQIPYTWNALTFFGAGSQTANLTNINGCDSSVTLNLSVSNIITSTNSVTICPSELPYSWNGLIFNSAGSQSISLTSSSGCDSIATLNLSVSTPQSSTSSVAICSNQLPYSWNGLVFNNSGSQTVILQDINGCDSSATLNLQVQNTLSSTTSTSVCPSELPYIWNNVVINSAGTESVTLTSIGGCDSIATLELSINPTYNTDEIVTICENETPFSWNGLTLSSSTSQSTTLTSVNGCDSIVNLNLTVLPVYNSTLDTIVCPNSFPFTWNNVNFNSAGSQNINFTGSNGCDSIVTLNVNEFDLPEILSINGGGFYCDGDNIQPIVVEVSGIAPFSLSYTLDGVGQTFSSTISTISIGNTAGTYLFSGISDQNCTFNSNLGTASIVINPIPPSPQVSSDSTYCYNFNPDTLVAIGNTNANFYWYDNPNLLNSIQTGMFYVPDNILGMSTYYVVQEENGCYSPPNNVIISFDFCDVIIPTAFTPDGDNVNDNWALNGIDTFFPENVVSIYNRWGNLLYQSEKGKYESNPWDGKFEGKDMPVGSYYFIIEYNDDNTLNSTGIVSIIK